MEREEKKGRERREGTITKQESTGLKLKRGVLLGKRGSTSTPPPTWRLGFVQPHSGEDLIYTTPTTITEKLSARKLGANLWEVLPPLTAAKMSKSGGARLPYRRKGFRLPSRLESLEDPPDSPHEEPESDSSLRRQVAASLIQHHRTVESNGHALLPVSPASYGSSMEVAPYNPAVTPGSSLEFKGRIRDSSFNLKTSTELLKVLNRIWSLEEQHASTMTLVSALKKELDHSRAQIKELLREKQINQQEMEDLTKQVADNKAVRKKVREEIEEERKLRKHSESLHRKLARELSDIKTSFSNALKELEREKKARLLLESLCDEFAKGIRNYEQEVRFLKHKPEKDRAHRESPDRLILHLSEAWLDERMQMKLAEPPYDPLEDNTIVDKLSLEIETFLQARHSTGSINVNDSSSKMPRESNLRRHSLESYHLNGVVSAPRNIDDEDSSSTSSDSNCFELNRASSGKQSSGSSKQHGADASESHPKEKFKSNLKKKRAHSRELVRGQPGLQMQFEQKMVGEQTGVKDPVEANNSQKHETGEDVREGPREKQNKQQNKRVGNPGLNTNHLINNLIRNHSLSLEAGKHHLEDDCVEDYCGQSAVPGRASPVQPWISRFTAPDLEVSETSSRWPHGPKENTLKAKLLEARLEGQRSHSKASKGS
ncbi:hypothetical protein NMG60_11022791 [Bertholletia excelsa]